MNLFISSSRYRNTAVPAGLTLGMLLVINAAVAALPDGPYQKQFDASLRLSKQMGSDATVVLFGDSRATMFRRKFFEHEILSLASENNTVIFSKFLFDRMIVETTARPKVMLLALGANNFNKNGIFPRRDFAIRRLASFTDMIDFTAYTGGTAYLLDALFAKGFPLHGRRMEIRSPALLRRILRQESRPIITQGMRPPDPEDLTQTPLRSAVADYNYWLVYQRSVYPNYELSRVHTGMLERLIDLGLASGAQVVLVQLPIEPMMLKLQREMVGRIFDDYLTELKIHKSVIHLDLRQERRFEFADLNHLSLRGGQELTSAIFNPLITRLLASRRGEQEVHR